VVQRPERVQVLQRLDQRLCRWRIEEIKVEQVVDTEGFQHQDDVAEVRPLDFGYRVRQELVVVRVFRIQPERFSRTDSTGSTGSLGRGSSRDLEVRCCEIQLRHHMDVVVRYNSPARLRGIPYRSWGCNYSA
jgi:hypothetical protein